ncbi:hypothetical protein CI610_00312 [invertebrate metagenome]|uniref:Uncharacterized protein n=1 Tax=invertebrate metagenome TaxID=1711999 RepID=A0A2H9TBM7_9ZZZZ
MTKQQRQHLLTAGLVLFNIMVLAPCAFIAGHIWEETQRWRAETEQQIDELTCKLSQFRATSVTREELLQHLDRINDRLINLK